MTDEQVRHPEGSPCPDCGRERWKDTPCVCAQARQKALAPQERFWGRLWETVCRVYKRSVLNAESEETSAAHNNQGN
jgi:hypothetical protein